MPDAVADLPHIKAQLAGITVRPVMEALREWLPRARTGAAEVLRVGKVLGLWRPRPDAGDEEPK